MRIHVAVTPEGLEGASLADRTALVVDVLRASTTIVAALAAGAAAVVPVGEPAEARRRLADYPSGTAVLAGERSGEPLAGFDLGNSPPAFTADRVAGKTVILTTSNGTRALRRAAGAAALGVAAVVNLDAAACWAAGLGRDVTIVCAAQRGRPCLEDQVAAGLLVDRLAALAPGAEPDPAARRVSALARPYRRDVARLAREAAWARRLAARGWDADVRACLDRDRFRLVPVYRPGVDKIVAGFP